MRKKSDINAVKLGIQTGLSKTVKVQKSFFFFFLRVRNRPQFLAVNLMWCTSSNHMNAASMKSC